MVTETSACGIQIPSNLHEKSSLLFDHSNMVKFPHRANDVYVGVSSKLQSLVGHVHRVASGRSN